MKVSAWVSACNQAQLVVAGIAAMLCVDQLAVWRWEGRKSPARFVALTAASVSGVLVTNVLVIASLGAARLNALVVVRGLFVGLMALSVLPLGGALAARRPPRWLSGPLAVVVVGRATLGSTTHLIYAFSTLRGLPRYGALEEPSSLAVLVLLFAYLLHIATLGRTEGERVVLTCGVLGSLLLAGIAVVGSGMTSELLTGYLVLPMLSAIVALIWMRQNRAHRVVQRFASRQRVIADLSRLALFAPVDDLVRAAERAIVGSLPGAAAAAALAAIEQQDADSEQFGDEGTPEREFVDAVRNVLHAASERQVATAALEYRANHDELTGLANRRGIRELVSGALCDRGAHRSEVAVAFCDLDRFETVNDAYGHQAGDELLRAVALRLSAGLRTCDRLGRFGSDEFVVVCTQSGTDDSVDELVARLQSALQEPIGPDRIALTPTIGVATSQGTDLCDGDSLLRDAMTAMHDAKRHARSTSVFRSELRIAAIERAHLEHRLARALERDEIVVHYQPIIDLASGRICALEALARWRQGEELVPPRVWIPIAESSEAIHHIGRHILAVATDQVVRWQRDGYLVALNVNVSARQLADPCLPDACGAALAKLGDAVLNVELTESLALGEGAGEAIDRLRGMGVGLALDDFGTGHSSLAVLSQLPIREVKLDRSIISRVAHPSGRALIEATLAIAGALDLSVVAEGIETAAQHDALVELGCHRGQGFLYGRPHDAEATTTLLARSAPLAPRRGETARGAALRAVRD